MKRLICWMLCIALMCGFLPAEAAAADPAAARTAEWIVEFDRQELAQSFARETGGRLLSPSDVLVSGGGRLGYLLRPGVTSVTANAVMEGCAQDFVYDDPMLVTSTEEGGYISYPPDGECQYYLRTIRMYDGWRGVEAFLQDSGRSPASVIVAVLDSGVDGTHPDLTGRVGEGYDIIRGCDIPAGADSDASQVSHGTMAAGLIAAQADNGLGIAGAAGAYPVTIMPVRILNEYDSGTVADTVAGIYWAADHGAQVLNLSFGSRMSSFPTAMQTAVDYARSRGCYVIAAAGNDGRALDEFRYHYYPAALEGVLAVGAEKKNIGYGSRYLESSNRPAKGTAGGSFFSICGEDLLTTVHGGGYGLFTGTSASCALFSGLVSLFLSADAARAEACIAGGAYILESDDPAECGTRIDAGEMALGLTRTVSRGSFLADADNPTLVQDETIVFSGTVFAPGVSGAKVCFEVETTRGALLGAETCSCDERGRVTLRMAMPEHSREELRIFASVLDAEERTIGERKQAGTVRMDPGYFYYSSIVVQDAAGVPISGTIVRVGSQETVTDRSGQAFYSRHLFDSGETAAIEGDGFAAVRFARLPMDASADPQNRIFLTAGTGNTVTVRGAAAIFGGAELFTITADGRRVRLYSLEPDGTAAFRLDGCTQLYVSVRTPAGDNALLSCEVTGDTVWDLDSALLTAVPLRVAEMPDENGSTADEVLLCLNGDRTGIPVSDDPVLISRGSWTAMAALRRTVGGKTSQLGVDFGSFAADEEKTLTVGTGRPLVTAGTTPAVFARGTAVTVTIRISDSLGNPVTELSELNSLTGVFASNLGYRSDCYDEANPETPVSIRSTMQAAGGGNYTYSIGTAGDAFGEHRLSVKPTVAAAFDAVITEAIYTVTDPNAVSTAAVALNITRPCSGITAGGHYALVRAKDGTYSAVPFTVNSIELPVGESYPIVSLTRGTDGNLYLARTEVDLRGAEAGSRITESLSFLNAERMTLTGGNVGAAIWKPFAELPDFQMQYAAVNGSIGAICAIGCGERETLTLALCDPAVQEAGSAAAEYEAVTAEADLSRTSVLETGLPLRLSTAGAVRTLPEGEALRLTPMLTDAFGNPILRLCFLTGKEETAGGDSGFTVTVSRLDGSLTRNFNIGFGETAEIEALPAGSYVLRTVYSTPARRALDAALTEEQYINVVSPDGLSVPAPQGFRAVTRSETEIELTWDAPAAGAVYRILRDGEPIAETDGSAYLDSGLTANRFYSYTVYTVLDGRSSDGAAVVGATRQGAALPAAPTDLRADFTDKGLHIAWDDPSADGATVTGYLVNVNGEDRQPVFYRSAVIARYLPGQDYTVTVRTVNGAGQESAPCAPLTVTAPAGTRILYAKADCGYSRLNVFSGNTMTVTADMSGDVTSAVCEAVYTDISGTHSVTVDLTDTGEQWTAALTLPFFLTVERVTVRAFAGAAETASADCPGFPIRRADNYTVYLNGASSRSGILDLSSCIVTLASPSLNWAVSQTAADFTGALTFSLADADDYILTVSDAGGAVFCRKTGLSVRDGESLRLSQYDINVIEFSVAADEPREGLRITVSTEDGTDVHTGVTDASGQAVFENGRRWFMAAANQTYTISCEPFELLCAMDGAEQEILVRYTPDEQTLRYRDRITQYTYTLRKPIVENRLFDLQVTAYGEALAGIPVQLSSNLETRTVYTDWNGRAAGMIQTVLGGTAMAAVERVEMSDGVETVPASCTLSGGDVLNVRLLRRDVRFRATAGEYVNGEIVTPEETPVWTLNGKPCLVRADGSLICYAADLVRGETAMLRCTLTRDGEQLFTEKQFRFDGETESDAGRLVFAQGLCFPTLVSSKSGTVRYLVFNDETGEPVCDLTAEGGAALQLHSGVRYRAIATTLLKGSGSMTRWMEVCASRTFRLEEGQSLTLELPDRPFPVEQIVNPLETGFSRAAACTWLDDSTVRVRTQVTLQFRKDSGAADCFAAIRLPAGAFDVTAVGVYGSFRAEYTDADGCPTVLLSQEDTDIGRFCIVQVSFSIPAQALNRDRRVEMELGATIDGMDFRTRHAVQTVKFAPAEISVPEIINQSRAAEGIPVYVCSSLTDREGWTFALFAGDELVYSGDLASVPASLTVHPADDLLGFHTLTARAEKNGEVYESQRQYEVADDRRPAMVSASFGSVDLLDHAHPLALYVNGSGSVTAEFTNPERVKDVCFIVRYAQKEEVVPLTRSGDVFTADSAVISAAAQPISMRIGYTEIPCEEASYGELRTDPDDLESHTFRLPDGAVFMPLPAEYGGSPAQQAQDEADWEKYLGYAASGIFRNGSEAEVTAALDDLFGEDGEWNLPAYLTAEGYLVRITMDRGEMTAKQPLEMTIDGLQRPVAVTVTQDEDAVTLLLEGMGDLFFPTAAADAVYSALPHVHVAPEVVTGVKVGIKAYGYGKAAYGLAQVERGDPEGLIDPLTGLLPYGGTAARMAAHNTLNLQRQRLQEIENLFCMMGETEHCAYGGGEGSEGGSSEGGSSEGGGSGSSGEGSEGVPINPLIDPSGYVFEAAADNRLEGVEAAIYYRVGSAWYAWNPTPYGEPENPSRTDAQGAYGWNVPAGEWKVVFAGDGYAPAASEVLTVPPEHLDVNISLVSVKTPELSSVLAMADGRRIRIAFDTYMDASTLTAGGTVQAFFGTEVCGAVLEPLDAVVSTAGNKQLADENSIVPGRTLAKVFWLTLDEPLPAGAQVNLKLSSECMGYHLKALAQDTECSVIIPEQDPVIPADSLRAADGSLIELAADESRSLLSRLVVTASDAAAALTWASSDPAVIAVSPDGTVTAMGAGTAIITASDGSHTAEFTVSAARRPLIPDAAENLALFCRSDNLVVDKQCWLYAKTAAEPRYPIAGDGRYVPVSWTIRENGSVTASGAAEDGAALRVPYVPQTPGASCCGTITFRLQQWDGSGWTDTDVICTASRTLPITAVTGISVKTGLPAFTVGDALELSGLVLNIALSDGSISEAPYAKFAGYGITFSIPEGTALTMAHRTLTIGCRAEGVTAELALDVLPSALSGTAVIRGTAKFGETLTAVTDEIDLIAGTLRYQWTRGGEAIPGAADSSYTLTEADIGSAIAVTVTGSEQPGAITSEATAAVEKADGPAAPEGLCGLACTTEANADGRITGTTAEMEYSADSGFAAKTACGEGETAGLSAGTCYVRMAETATHKAGAAAAVTVGAYVHTHVYDREVADGSYLKAPADCEHAAVYFRSCACGACSTEETFVSGSPLGHDWGEWRSLGSTQHQRACRRDAAHAETEAHRFDGGVCTVCGEKKPAEEIVVPTLYSLTFRTNGGTAIDRVTGEYGSRIGLEDFVPEKAGCVFAGWCSDSALTLPVTEIRLTASTTVYAKWAEAPAFPFTDVAAEVWSREDIRFVWEKGLMKGVSETEFAPQAETSRAMLVTILWRLAGEPTARTEMRFEDVAPGQWYSEAIRWAQEAGIVNGYSAERFGPHDPVTREQMAAIFCRFAASRGCDVSARADLTQFADYGSIDAWALESVAWAKAVGLLNGVSSTELDPLGMAKREQTAAILHRFSDRLGF